jgi:hypothetical protein
MQRFQIHTSQSLRGVQQFLDAHAEVVGAANATDARQQLDAVIGLVDKVVVEQDTQSRETRGEVSRRRQLENVLIRRYMTPLAKLARAQLRVAPGYAALTPSAGALRTERLVVAARSMAIAAAPYAANLAAAMFPPDFLEQLRTAADTIQSSLDSRARKGVQRVGATRQVATALKQGRNAVATLDAIVSHLILGNDRLEREWRAAKRVQRAPSRAAAASPAVAGSIQPMSPVPLAPAGAAAG